MNFRSLFAFLVLLIPSFWYAFRNPDLPDLGKLHDDALLFVSAKSLGTGQGFRILSLPEQPAQTKYPILYPLYLSVIWKLNPNFPANLALARWMSWPLLVLSLALVWIYWRGSTKHLWLIVGLLAISPYMILFGCGLFSEIFFLCWLLASLIAARREGVAMAILAGVLAGLAYLSRTAGIALLLSMPAYYLWHRESRRAAGFAAGMLPFVAGWTLWSALHKFPASDPTLIYYTDYMKFQFLNVGFDNLAVVLWKNIDALLYSIGSLVIPPVIGLLPVKILTQVVAIAMISGVVRLARRNVAVPYAFFALVSSGMLIVWHFPPTERFVLPIFPLLAAGLFVEGEHLVRMLGSAFRHKDAGQRVIAYGFAACVGLLAVASLGLELFMTFDAMPGQAALDRAHRNETTATYAWIAQNLPAGATILSNDDPMLYLYTGHCGSLLPVLPRWWYAEDHTKLVGFFKNVVPYCHARGYDYILSTSADTSRWTGDEDTEAVRLAMESNPALDPIFKSPSGATLYRVRRE